MRAIFMFVFSVFPCISWAASRETIHGQGYSCWSLHKLGSALESPDGAYFSGWTQDDFAAAERLNRECAPAGWSYDTEHRSTLIAARAQAIQQAVAEGRANDAEAARIRSDEEANEGMRRARAAEQAKAQAQLRADESQRREDSPRLARERRAADEERDAAIEARFACQESRAYQLFAAHQSVLSDLEGIRSARKDIADEREVGQASGYVNAETLHDRTKDLIEMQRELAKDWAQYRRLGGKVAKPEALPPFPTDPC